MNQVPNDLSLLSSDVNQTLLTSYKRVIDSSIENRFRFQQSLLKVLEAVYSRLNTSFQLLTHFFAYFFNNSLLRSDLNLGKNQFLISLLQPFVCFETTFELFSKIILKTISKSNNLLVFIEWKFISKI